MRNKKIIAKLLVLGVCTSLTAGITAINPVNVFADTTASVTETFESISDWGTVSLGGMLNLKDSVIINKVAFTRESDSTAAVSSIDNSLTKLDIPRTITVNGQVYTVDTIKEGACKTDRNNDATTKQLTEVTIHNTIKNIESWTFSGNTCLTTVNFDDNSSLKEIATGTFAECSNLKKVNLPKTIERIRGFAFNNCKKLGLDDESGIRTFKVPYTVDCIDPFAFVYVSDETSPLNLIIPDTVVNVGIYAFANTNNMNVIVKGRPCVTPGGSNLMDLGVLVTCGSGVTSSADNQRVFLKPVLGADDYYTSESDAAGLIPVYSENIDNAKSIIKNYMIDNGITTEEFYNIATSGNK